MDARPIWVGCVLARAQPVVLETFFNKKLIWHLILSPLWDLRSCWFMCNICLSRLAVCYSSRAAAQSTPAVRVTNSHQSSNDAWPFASYLWGFVWFWCQHHSLQQHTGLCIRCNLGSINNVSAVTLPSTLW